MRQINGGNLKGAWPFWLAPLLFCVAAVSAKADCRGEDGGTSIVTSITAGETLILEDGRAVRLMGILGPKRVREGPASEARARMEAALAALTLGKKVSLNLDQRKRDRYGRVLAHIYVSAEGSAPVWIQAKLVEEGLARVISFPDNRLCVKELLAIEHQARQAQSGFWRTGFFAVRPANAEDLLLRLAQSYEIIEGRVSNVAEIKGRTYINFGQNWRRDFTIFVPAKSGQFQAADTPQQSPPINLASLNGRQIRVRGWLKNYNGPSITVTHPEQIEVLSDSPIVVR